MLIREEEPEATLNISHNSFKAIKGQTIDPLTFKTGIVNGYIWGGGGGNLLDLSFRFGGY